MSDLRFDEVVIDDRKFSKNDNRAHKALCATCSEWNEVTDQEFRWPFGVEREDLRYVALMRAWNCCHEEYEPLDGAPEKPSGKLLASEER